MCCRSVSPISYYPHPQINDPVVQPCVLIHLALRSILDGRHIIMAGGAIHALNTNLSYSCHDNMKMWGRMVLAEQWLLGKIQDYSSDRARAKHVVKVPGREYFKWNMSLHPRSWIIQCECGSIDHFLLIWGDYCFKWLMLSTDITRVLENTVTWTPMQHVQNKQEVFHYSQDFKPNISSITDTTHTLYIQNKDMLFSESVGFCQHSKIVLTNVNCIC